MTATASRNGVPADPREAALYYIDLGVAPIPVPPRSKKPRLDGWRAVRVTRDTIDDFFPAGEPLNVGHLNGEPSGGEVDVDLDCVEAVRAAPMLLPATSRISGRPSNPRSHWWYRLTDPPDKAKEQFFDPTVPRKKDDPDGHGGLLAELRSTGGHTLVPPSWHDTKDERYVWHSFGNPAELTTAELRAAVRAVAAAALLGKHWPRGARHDAALALAGGLARAAWGEERVRTFVEAVCRTSDDEESNDRARAAADTVARLRAGESVTGWPTLERLIGDKGPAVVRQARAWLLGPPGRPRPATGKPAAGRSVEPYRPFPVAVLPEPLKAFVVQVAAALRVDPSFVALPALAAVASAIGNTRVILLKRGWAEPCVVWAVTVGDSGTLKSPAYRKAVAYLYTVQKRLRAEFLAACATYEDALAEWKRKKKDEPDAAGDPPDKPVTQRVICSDVTIEKLAEVLEDNARGILSARDELSAWFGSFTRYKGKGGGSDLPHWLEAYQAATWLVDRKGGDRKHYFVPRANVSVTGTIQPGILAHALTQEVLDSGHAARLLLAMPPKREKVWTEDEVAPEVEAAYHTLLDRLLALDFKGDDHEPHALGLSAAGMVAWKKFYKEWAAAQAAAEGELAAALSKLEGYAARLALVHHVVTHVGLEADDIRPIGVKSIEAGATLCRWFAAEARRVLSIVTETNEERDTRRLVEFIRARGGTITVKQLQRSNQRKYPVATAAEAALEALAGAGRGAWVDRPSGPQGGRPTREFVLRCDGDETDETPPDGGGDDGPPESDDTPGPAAGTSGLAGENGVSSVSSVVTHESIGTESGPAPVIGQPEVSSSTREVSSDMTDDIQRSTAAGHNAVMADPLYTLVTHPADLPMVATAVGESAVVGLDTETTGLDPRANRVRLLTLACDNTDGGVTTYILDLFAVDPAPLWGPLASVPIVGHNLLFDLQFLARLGFAPGTCRDTLLMSQVLHAGDPAVKGHKLADCSLRELGEAVAKGEQASGWSGPLSPAQLAYAARDAEVVRRLHDALAARIDAAGLAEAAAVEHAALPAVAWLAGAGVGFDKACWDALAAEAQAEADRLAAELDRTAPPRAQGEMFGSGWKWDSPEHVRDALAAVGCGVRDTDDDTLAAVDHPLAARLRDYRAAKKRATTYGAKWLKGSDRGGRVYAAWRQLGANSGRMACSAPNLQNLPRDARYRRCFAAPPGRVLVKADYSQIELRIAATVAGERAMADAYARGQDLHTLTARRLVGREDVTKADRQLAKAVNFGLLYGMGAKGFRIYARSKYGVELSPEDAERYRAAFFTAYPALRSWHGKVGRTKDQAVETRTLADRRCLNVRHFNEKLNLPVQGTGADGLKRALGLLWERRGRCPGAIPVLAVHDEIVVECDAGQADVASAWLKGAMLDGMAPLVAPVPVEVEVQVAPTWGG